MNEVSTITWHPAWELTPRRKTALLRLGELGVRVSAPVAGGDGFRVVVPFDLHPDVYVEVGYLIAQLGYEAFPEDFHRPIADVSSKLFGSQPELGAPVRSSESIPDGFRYWVDGKKPSARSRASKPWWRFWS